MDKWVKLSFLVAVTLAGTGASYYLGWAKPIRFLQDKASFAKQLDESWPAPMRTAIVDCHEAAQMFFDVKWAAACMAHVGQASSGSADDHSECDLPLAQAAVINAWLDEAAQRCMSEARAGLESR